jgi:hypothetical protein
MGTSDSHQLQLFRPSSINLNEPADHCQFVARLKLEGNSYYLTPEGRWSTDLQAAETFSSAYAAKTIAQAALDALDATSWLPWRMDCPPARRGLVVLS